jgi:hypothetical protein
MFGIKHFKFSDYLVSQGWEKSKEGFFAKGQKTIKYIRRNQLMIALNLDSKVKHKHIVTCTIPSTKKEAEIMCSLTMLNQ